jgi:hypothetical protein
VFKAYGTSSNGITFTSVRFPDPIPGDWNGIFLYGGPDTMKYTTVKFAKYDIAYFDSIHNVVLNNCLIDSSQNYGIYGSNTGTADRRVILQYSTIQNSLVGIGLNSSRADLYNTRIQNNTSSYSGGILGINSKLYMQHCNIQNNSGPGILMDGSTSFAYFSPGTTIAGHDTVRQNVTAEVKLINSAGAYLGQRVTYICGYSCEIDKAERGDEKGIPTVSSTGCPPVYCTTDYAGYNNIYDSFSSSGRLVYNYTGGTVLAQLNYWGACPPDQTGFVGTVDRSAYLCSLQKTSPKGEPSEVSSLLASSQDNSSTPIADDAQKNKYWIQHLMRTLVGDPDGSAYVLHLLSTLVKPNDLLPDSKNTSWQSYLANLSAHSLSAKVKALASAYLIQAKMDLGDYDNALTLANSTLSNDPSDDLWMFCQMQKFNSYLTKGDIANATSAYSILQNRGASIDPATISMLGHALNMAATGSHSSTQPGQLRDDKSGSNNNEQIPAAYALLQNYPNPFNPVTRIQYQLPQESRVNLSVFNILGQKVATLVDEVQNEGYKAVSFNANNLPSGVYFYRLQAGNFNDVKKFILMK